jgi:sugar lactone lactonase YvrE
MRTVLLVVGALGLCAGCGGAGQRPAAPPVDAGSGPADGPVEQQEPLAADARAPGDAGLPADFPAVPDAGAAPADAAFSTPPMGPFPLERVRAARAETVVRFAGHTEGPSWRTGGDMLLAADGSGLLRMSADGKLFRYHPRLDPVGSYALADGSVLICDKVHIVAQVFPDGKVGVIADQFQGQAIGFCNDVTVDAAGNIYFTEAHAGIIYRVTPAGEVARVAGGYDYPNGIEVDPASKYLYFATAARLYRVALPAAGSGSFPPPEGVGSIGGADGMAFDAWGNLWVAAGGGRVAVFDPRDKTTIASIGAGGQGTNMTFGGPARDTLYVTYNGGVARIPVGVRGFLHPGAPRYAIKTMLALTPADEPIE